MPRAVRVSNSTKLRYPRSKSSKVPAWTASSRGRTCSLQLALASCQNCTRTHCCRRTSNSALIWPPTRPCLPQPPGAARAGSGPADRGYWHRRRTPGWPTVPGVDLPSPPGGCATRHSPAQTASTARCLLAPGDCKWLDHTPAPGQSPPDAGSQSAARPPTACSTPAESTAGWPGTDGSNSPSPGGQHACSAGSSPAGSFPQAVAPSAPASAAATRVLVRIRYHTSWEVSFLAHLKMKKVSSSLFLMTTLLLNLLE